MSTKVKKAVIPAAGLGTRFFPATKTVPKEMLPIVDKPTILYVIEEALAAGIEDIILIQGRGKTAIEDFFDISVELENKLITDGKSYLLKDLNHIRNNINIISVRQKTAMGLGHAIHCAKSVIGSDPFAVLLGDEITVSKEVHLNPTRVLCEEYKNHLSSSVWVLPVDPSQTQKYGIVDFVEKTSAELTVEKLSKGKIIKGVIEKPDSVNAPSFWALPGRYVFNSSIFNYIEQTKPGFNGEIQLSDAMNLMAQKEKLYAYSVEAERFDAGDKLGYIIANIEMGLKSKELQSELKNYLLNRIQTLQK